MSGKRTLAVGVAAQDPGGPAFVVVTGHGHSVTFSANGRRPVTFGAGCVENLCQTLADPGRTADATRPG